MTARRTRRIRHEPSCRNEELTGFLEHLPAQRPPHSRQAERPARPGITPVAAA
jgi:hypothetical protein